MPEPLAKLLEPYGAAAGCLVDLRQAASPENLHYLDLVQAKDRRAVPDGVVEVRNETLAYVAAHESHPQIVLPQLKKTVTLRGDAPYLVILEPGRLTVYDTSWRGSSEPICLATVPRDDERAGTTFQQLSLGLPREKGTRRYLHELLFKLLSDAIDGMIERRIGRDDAVSLVGRALFMRFLIDRQIVQKRHLRRICPTADRFESVFSGRQRAKATCSWLDETFNGDFLPLNFLHTPGGFDHLAEGSLGPLEDVMYRSPGGQLLLNWGDLNFAHVPIGLLSQVYERQAETWAPRERRKSSVYYTPYRIADFMVQEVFAGLFEAGAVWPHEARVLDPAAGGGVFLVSAFEQIVAAWWRHHGRAPKTREIRRILYQQLSGFEISEPALRLAALSLYLKAIELDLDPHPPEKLVFEPLRGRVLHQVRPQGEEEGSPTAGSLGRGVSAAHRGAHDVVIGNPPWTTLGKENRKLHAQIVEGLRPLVAERLGSQHAADFEIPDQLPDLPFVWRATEWAKPEGSIAFALHGRVLFKGSEGGREAREALFKAVSVTGVLNGADLRKTNVWPEIEHPFCLFFARNQRPGPEHAFLFTSPYREDHLNRQGRLRIDAHAAHPISSSRLESRPELLKAMFRGTALDVATLDKIRDKSLPTVARSFVGRNGAGYQVKGRKQDPDFLKDLPDLTTAYAGPILVEASLLPGFARETVHFRRKREIFEGPLVVARKSMPLDRHRGRAFCCFSDVAYSESFYGYSARGHGKPETLARYLVLLLHSDLFLWHVLMTSGQFGVERDALYKEDVDSFPLRPLEDLPGSLLDGIEPLSGDLFAGRSDLWPELDAWASRVYGLHRWDQEAIRDTLATRLPYAPVIRESQRPPRDSEVEDFASRLQSELQPFARTARRALKVRRLAHPADAPWEVLVLEAPAHELSRGEAPDLVELRDLFDRADREGASQIILVKPARHRLLLGILRQYRYWTQSRARLCALEILEAQHLGVLLAEVSLSSANLWDRNIRSGSIAMQASIASFAATTPGPCRAG